MYQSEIARAVQREGEDDLQAIASDSRACLARSRIQLRNLDGRSKTTACSECTLEEIPIPSCSRPVQTREVECKDAGLRIDYQGRVAVIPRAVHVCVQIDRCLPREIIVDVAAVGYPKIKPAKATGTIAAEVQRVAVGRLLRHAVEKRSGRIEDGTKVLRRPPRVVHVRALRDVHVRSPEAAWPVRLEVKTQPVGRNRWARLVGGSVDD